MSTMTDDETYNGYKNRETWAFNLHWENDQSLYAETLEEARRYIEETYGKADHLIHDKDERSAAYYGAGRHVITYWRDLIDEYRGEGSGMELPEALVMFDREVGSWWRVDAREVGEAIREGLANES